MNEEAFEILEDIKSLNDQQLKAYVEFIVKRRKEESKNINEDNFIGYNLPINLEYPNLDIRDYDGKMWVLYNTYFKKYIHDEVKLLYGRIREDNNKMGSLGYYYYVKNHEYIYEFLNFIKNEEIEDDFSLIYYIFYFIRNYFGLIGKVTRENISGLVLDSHGKYLEPTQEHTLLDFKHKGCAKCSEYTVVMENILSFFNYQTAFIMGSCDEDLHAYNIIFLDNEYYLIDASYCTSCYDINNKYIKAIPYIIKLNNYDQEEIKRFITDDVAIVASNCYALVINDNFYEIEKDSKRVYKTLTKKSDEI